MECFTMLQKCSTRDIRKWASLLNILRRALRTNVIGTTTHSRVLDPPLLILHFVRHAVYTEAFLSVEEVVVYVLIIIHP